ncbi:adhesion G-protein coupled receptor G4-like [Myxocyprinus asiaticus]|uniref:adhesion G-protein coupled receptor G4-like n=1 Tax=Myxocyprinus asiaticus TaxID=70543 RepID=UPI0022239A57|nr:adhesion G-protein coupled receptor G4-like [Myxocyprinus asiaticus]
MLYKHSKHVSGRYKNSAHHFVWILCLWVHFLPQVDGFFMSDAKAVLQGCEDHWTFQPQGHSIPVLFQMTVCVDVQVLSPGEWTAFSYISAPAPRYELALQGDENSLYAWLLGVRHQFPVQLTLRRWYRLCLRWDAPHKSFSLTIGGSSEVYQRTAIARAIPPSGRLLLGCQPKDTPPGVNMATVELYLFRIWNNVGEHRACEDGTVVGWDSRLWTITRAQARIQDYKLQCGLGHLRMKRNALGTTTPFNTSQGVAAGRDFYLTSPSPLYSTLNSIITNAQKLTQGLATNPSGTLSVTTTTLPPQGQVSSTTSASTRTTSNSSYGSILNITTTRPAGLSTPTTPSVNLTTPAKAPLIVTTTSSATITASPQALISSAVTTTNTSHAGGLNISVQPTSEITANHTAASSPAAPIVMNPFVVQCNFSQYCANESSYYWMLVEVHGSNMTEEVIQIWFSDHFNMSICSAGVPTTEINNTTCQSSMVYVTAEVTCQDKENIERTNCTVLLQLSQPVNKCILRRLVENGPRDPLIQIYLMGDIERVGLCKEHNISSAGDGIVHCTSPMSYNDVCQTLGAVNVTCSYVEKDFVPNDFNVVYNQSCNVKSQQHCECHASHNNETYYALRLNITKPDVNFTSIQNTVLQLSTPCEKSSIPGSLCNTISEVSQFYQGMHLECYGEEKRLYTCMLALQMSKQLDVCTVSTVMAGLWKDSTSVSFDGPLTRIAICRLPTDSETILLNSTFTWVFVDSSASQINYITDQLKCEQGHTFAVLLNESCVVSPSESYTTPPVPHSTSTENSATSPIITSPSFTTDWMLSNQTSTTGRLHNTSKTPLNTTVSISNISFMSINSTVTQTSTASLNTTKNLPLIATVTLRNTTVIPLNITSPLVNTTVIPFNTTVTSHNANITLLNTTDTPFNITTPLVNTNLTQLNPTVTTLEATDGLLNTPVTSHNTAITLLNTTDTPFNITFPLVNTNLTQLNPTVTTLVATDGLLNTPVTSHNTAITLLNTTVTPLNITTQLVNTTVTPLNPTATTLSATDTMLNTTDTSYNTTITLLNKTFTPPIIIPPVNTTVTPLNPTVTTLNATDGLLNTTDTPLNITIPFVNATTIPLNTTVTTFNALLNTTVLSLNITTPLVNTTTIPLNTTIRLSTSMALLNTTSMPDRPLNTTVTSQSSPFTALNTTVALHHTTVTPFNTTVTPRSTPLLSIFTTQLNSTGPENTTISIAASFTYLNATTSVQNSTQLSLLNTTESLNTTLTDKTTLPGHIFKNKTSLYVTYNTNISLQNEIIFHTMAPLDNTTQANTTASTKNLTESNTPQTFQNITEFSTSAIPYNTTFYTMAPSDNTTQANTTALAINVRESNTTQPLENTTDFSMPSITYNTTQLLNSSTLETSGAETTTTELTTTVNTTMYTPNFRAFNTTTDIPDLLYPNETFPLFNTTQSNAADFPLNMTLFNTTEMPVNVTTHNRSDTNRGINITETSNSTSRLNTTANPVTDTTQFNSTNTTQIHATTFPTTENITSGNIITVSLLNTTQLNATLEKASTDNTIMNTTTTINPINIQHNTTITSIVTNNSAAPTTAISEIHPSSHQSIYNSTTASPIVPQITISRGNTLGTTARPAVPATSAITTAITSVIATTQTPDSVAKDLLNQTKDVKNLNSSEVNKLVSQLENLLTAPNISKDLGTTVLSVINNLLNGSSDSLAKSSNRLIKAVDSLGLKLVIQDQTESIAFESLSLAVTKVDGTNFGTTSFSMANPLKPQVTKGFQREIRAVESSSPLGKITLPASLTENLSPEEQKIASRVQFTFFQKSTFFQDQALTQQTLNSHILGSSVANLSIKNLRENVEFTLKNKQPVVGNYVASCVFWDFGINDGLGGWSSSGCFVKNSSTQNETVCSCNHLTSFAVLLDVSRQGITDRLQATILTFITYIGCGISAIFLSVTLLTYLAFDKIRRDIPSKILIHLCFGLLLLNLVFLLDSWLALYPNAVGLCISTAFFLHYFLLVSFTWMGLESLHMYLSIVKVFNNYMSRYMLKFSLTGWGVPLIVVIIVIAVNKDNYGLLSYGKYSDGTTDDFCWLKNDIAFYVAVVAYFCIIFVLNVAMFVVVMVHLRRIKRQNPHNNQYRSGLHDLRSIAGLTFLLGLTWGFAFFAWGPVNLAFMYLFAIFNSLQGFFIFLFHCALKENVRKQWRMYLCCGRLRLAENSEWSRTATQSNTKKTSILTTNSSNLGSHSAQRSSVSSDESVPSNGIGSPIGDSLIMSEETTDDVVLNEMNSQLRPRIRSV